MFLNFFFDKKLRSKIHDNQKKISKIKSELEQCRTDFNRIVKTIGRAHAKAILDEDEEDIVDELIKQRDKRVKSRAELLLLEEIRLKLLDLKKQLEESARTKNLEPSTEDLDQIKFHTKGTKVNAHTKKKGAKNVEVQTEANHIESATQTQTRSDQLYKLLKLNRPASSQNVPTPFKQVNMRLENLLTCCVARCTEKKLKLMAEEPTEMVKKTKDIGVNTSKVEPVHDMSETLYLPLPSDKRSDSKQKLNSNLTYVCGKVTHGQSVIDEQELEPKDNEPVSLVLTDASSSTPLSLSQQSLPSLSSSKCSTPNSSNRTFTQHNPQITKHQLSISSDDLSLSIEEGRFNAPLSSISRNQSISNSFDFSSFTNLLTTDRYWSSLIDLTGIKRSNTSIETHQRPSRFIQSTPKGKNYSENII